MSQASAPYPSSDLHLHQCYSVPIVLCVRMCRWPKTQTLSFTDKYVLIELQNAINKQRNYFAYQMASRSPSPLYFWIYLHLRRICGFILKHFFYCDHQNFATTQLWWAVGIAFCGLFGSLWNSQLNHEIIKSQRIKYFYTDIYMSMAIYKQNTVMQSIKKASFSIM